MRLTDEQIQAIKRTAWELFGTDAEVYLFGSRTDDARRGGDIDLFIEAPLDDSGQAARLRIRFLARLKQKIGDQRIDLVLHRAGETNPPYVAQVARRTGVRL